MKFSRERAALARDYRSEKAARDTLRALNLKLAVNLKFYRAIGAGTQTNRTRKSDMRKQAALRMAAYTMRGTPSREQTRRSAQMRITAADDDM